MPTPADKPTVTDDHIKKYEEIMKTGTLQTGTPAMAVPSSATTEPKSSKIASILAALPKPKGIGNKMFVFTGKKKIIMDDGQREVEKAKTIDPKEMKKLQKDEEKKEEETLAEPPIPVRVEEDKEAEKKLEKKLNGIEKKNEDLSTSKAGKPEKKVSSQEAPKGLIFGGIALLIIWTAAWAYFLGYFTLLGL